MLSQLQSRRWRALSLAAAILVATASFGVLTAAGRTTETRVRGSVESNYRTAYDILVRPKRNQLPLEREQGLVRNNYLSGLFGGIALAEWEEIRAIGAVQVAAPIANIGFVIPRGGAGFRINGLLNDDPVQLYRVNTATVAHRGTSEYRVASNYVYYTRVNRFSPPGDGGYKEILRGGEIVEVCPNHGLSRGAGPFVEGYFRDCYSARSPGLGSDTARRGVIGAGAQLAFPIMLAGIDPVEEAKLLGLDTTVVSGRYLRRGEKPRLARVPATKYSPNRIGYHRVVPILASTRTYIDEHAEVRIERLVIPPGTNVPRKLASEEADEFLDRLPGDEIARRRILAKDLYEGALGPNYGRTEGPKNSTSAYWPAAAVRYRSLSRPLSPIVVKSSNSIWRSPSAIPGGGGYVSVPRANADLHFRKLKPPRVGSTYFETNVIPGAEVYRLPIMYIVGRYDPEKLPGFSILSQVPLETYYPPELLPADTASRVALGGKPLLPSQNIGDYVAQPPLFLTTLQGMRPFLNPKYYAGARRGRPISVVRVRVRGVTGPDAESQARIRQVAAEIHDRTGLQVDITAGSSPRKLLVKLPPGRFGRPALLLEEGWSKKGVSLSFLQGLDNKRLGLLSMILVACTFFLANGAFASVRGRKTEIGTLRCLGWPGKAIFGVILAELVLIGALAGLAAAAFAVGIAELFSLELSLTRALLAAPLAVVLAAVAGVVPAWRGVRLVPMDAVRPAVVTGSTRRPVRRLLSFALSNVRRMPARTLAAAAGFFLGASALTLLVAINQAFQGRLVGTLLGEVVSGQVRGLDFLVVGVVVLLAGLSLADVLYLNLRERAAEFVTLKTVGWSDHHLARVIAAEAIVLALVGTVPGVIAGGTLGLLLDASLPAVALGAAASVLGGLVVALLASLLPVLRLAALTAPSVLAEE
ncbi:MAG: FtsX-like permease family protein [Gaiellaceae bacterium]